METALTARMGPSEEFVAKGLMIRERNWLEIYAPWERWWTGEGEIPSVEVGTRFVPDSLTLETGRTTAPQPISEVELITAMDKNKIGTDATIAQHIETIQKRSYATKDTQQRFHPTPLGIGLVEAYNAMGHQLNRPDLRRKMEAECGAVAAGTRTKEQVMDEILTMMANIYRTVVSEAAKLDAALGRHFPRIGDAGGTSVCLQQNFSRCGSCGGGMALKRSGTVERPTRLLYCNACRRGYALPARGDLSALEGGVRVVAGRTEAQPAGGDGGGIAACPICSFQVLQVSAGLGYEGGGYKMCPFCFSNPPTNHGGGSIGSEFRCFNCSNSECAFASGVKGGNVALYPCPFCAVSGRQGGSITLRKVRTGFMLSCGAGKEVCNYALFLPRAAALVEVAEVQEAVGAADGNQGGQRHILCAHCSGPERKVLKLRLAWKIGSVPPHYGRAHVACALCDELLMQEMGVRQPIIGAVNLRPVGNRGRGGREGVGRGRSNRAGREGGRGRGRGRGRERRR